ncbi:site-specific integrase [Streptomyces sp. TRM49041]|uniref:tyrosine-type recombinase/integrase n=1 Tax=Streptomyces sp. TRM49041 TaxID=2603216 RepID=UPI0011EE1261|nr:site-specific integrase [Streptomyces sp. TRM49041]
MTAKGTTTKRCFCRRKDGKPLGSSCPNLKQRTHGVWSIRQELPPTLEGDRRLFRRAGYDSQTKAQADLDKVRALLNIADKDDKDGRARLGDLLASIGSGKEQIPDYDETKRKFGTGQSLTQHMTVAEWLDLWLAGKKGLRKSGHDRYELDIRCHLRPRIGHIRLDRLTVPHLDAMFEGIAETNIEITEANATRRAALAELKTIPWKGGENRARRKGMKEAIDAMKPFRRITGPSTQQHIRATLRAALNTAIARGSITFNAAQHVELAAAKRPKAMVWTDERIAEWLRTGEKPSAVMVWTPEQAGHFLDFLADFRHRLLPMFHLITFRGLRRGEACGVRWSDYNTNTGELTVATQLVQDGWEVVESAPKTDSGERIISLDEYTVEVLEAHRTKQGAERVEWGEAWTDTGRMFTQENGEWLHPGTLTDQFERLVELSGLPPIRMHDLRHVAASLMLAAGVDVKIVSETLGHSDSRITRDIYQSVMPKAARDAAEATAAMVPRGAMRRPVQVVAEVEAEPANAEVAPVPAQQNGHAMGTQGGAKIIEFRPRLVRA